MPKKADPVIDEVRQTRHEISARVGHDPASLVTYYIKVQARYRERLLPPSSSRKTPGKPAA